ncbi:MAG: SOS response-associated peptidase family protein [Pseudomonadota bacterium]
MCNLYQQTKSAAEVAAWFRAVNGASGANLSDEIYPGYPGLVRTEESLRAMTWGFPLARTSTRTGKPLKPKPVNNAREEKLDSFMWKRSFVERRCLIPLTAWAEAEGPKGSMTRTWLKPFDVDLFAVAGIWRDTEEWGECYSMIMIDAAGKAASVHSRMPVLLEEPQFEHWLRASPVEARALCRPFDKQLSINRTWDPWYSR